MRPQRPPVGYVVFGYVVLATLNAKLRVPVFFKKVMQMPCMVDTILRWLLLWAKLCSPQIHMLKFQCLLPQNVTVFGDKFFIVVIKLKSGH